MKKLLFTGILYAYADQPQESVIINSNSSIIYFLANYSNIENFRKFEKIFIFLLKFSWSTEKKCSQKYHLDLYNGYEPGTFLNGYWR